MLSSHFALSLDVCKRSFAIRDQDNPAIFHSFTEPPNRHTPHLLKASAQNLLHPTLDDPLRFTNQCSCWYANYQAIPAELRNFARHCQCHLSLLERQHTEAVQGLHINKLLQFCSKGSHDPLHPIVRAVLCFLHSVQECRQLLYTEYSPFSSLQH